MQELTAFGDLVRRYRARAGLTQETLAERVGLSTATISAIERGVHRRPYPRTIEWLADALGLSGAERTTFVARRAPVRAVGPPAAPSPPSPPRTNLPARRTPLIGRASDAAAVAALVLQDPGRLVTLTGAGGCGKTSLALKVASDLRGAFPDGVWWVELAALDDAALVPPAVAAAAGIGEAAAPSPLEALVAAWHARAPLIALDNCEHLVEACAHLAERLLSSCPTLRILATSREPLQLRGERQWRVPTLAVPDPKRVPQVEELARYPAVQLFVERARAVDADFRLTPANGQAVARVCARLDGLPLAIELAAARAHALSAEQIEARLGDRFRLLAGGGRAVPSRQQTLRAALDWSHDLLTEPERTLFRRLSVFSGGWALEAAEAVCAGGEVAPADVLDVLTRLVDRSLVVAEVGGEGARYRLLETVRAYAMERLEADAEADATRERHAAHYLALAIQARPHGTRPRDWLRGLGPYHDNLRAAFRWFEEQRDIERGSLLGDELWAAWAGRGYVAEARAQTRALLARAREVAKAPDDALARILWWAALFAYMGGGYVEARAYGEELLAVWRRLGDRSAIAWTLSHLGIYAREQGDYVAACSLLEESIAIYGELGDRRGRMDALIRLGEVHQATGDLGPARACYAESEAILADLGERSVRVPHHLGSLALDEGDVDEARRRFRESLALQRDVGDWEWLHSSLADLASVAAAEGQMERALRLAGAAEAFGEATGTALQPTELVRLERWLGPARRALGEERARAAWAAGKALPPERAVAEALAVSEARALPVARGKPRESAPTTLGAVEPLTPREAEVARLLARGLTDRQVAEALGISARTAGVHVQRLLAKLGVRSRWQVADWAARSLPNQDPDQRSTVPYAPARPT